MVLAVVLGAEVALPIPSFFLHLGCCKTVKMRMWSLWFADLLNGSRGPRASCHCHTTTGRLRHRGAVGHGGLNMTLLVCPREAHGLLEVDGVLHLHVSCQRLTQTACVEVDDYPQSKVVEACQKH